MNQRRLLDVWIENLSEWFWCLLKRATWVISRNRFGRRECLGSIKHWNSQENHKLHVSQSFTINFYLPVHIPLVISLENSNTGTCPLHFPSATWGKHVPGFTLLLQNFSVSLFLLVIMCRIWLRGQLLLSNSKKEIFEVSSQCSGNILSNSAWLINCEDLVCCILQAPWKLLVGEMEKGYYGWLPKFVDI